MDLLKKFWPTPFKIKDKDVVSFVIQLIIFVVICAVVGFLIGILAGIPVIGIIFSILGSLMELYGLVGIVLCSWALYKLNKERHPRGVIRVGVFFFGLQKRARQGIMESLRNVKVSL